ncbi:C-3 sterol dehydrogenase/C-4 decarboxylase family protein [Nemania sp. FL0031]|nr:C-3 sterol dehydrogenase/C-4 decarboxylase family protein [Nemania sp. FL0031]
MAEKSQLRSTIGPVVVTGGCGFIGSHTVEGLVQFEPGCQIYVIDIDTSRNRVAGVSYRTCDISLADEVDAVFAEAKPKTVFQVACPDSTRVQTVRAFVNTSTSSVIHDNLIDLFDADETFPVLKYPAQKRIYTLTKAEAEADIIASNRASGDASMLTVSLRPATAFGERDTVCLGKFVTHARAGKAKIQVGPGNNMYDFIYVSNLVDAHILAAQALTLAYGRPAPPPEIRVDGQAFNVTNEEPVEFWDFQRSIAASVGLPVKKEEIWVVPVWIAVATAALSEWLYWVFTLGEKQPIVTRKAIHLTTITRTLSNAKARRAGRWLVEEAKKAKGSKKAV